MQITYKKLRELSGLGDVVRIYMDSYRLSKYQTMKFAKRGKIVRKIRAVKFNQEFINAFCEYLKIKQKDYIFFKWNAEHLLKGNKK